MKPIFLIFWLTVVASASALVPASLTAQTVLSTESSAETTDPLQPLLEALEDPAAREQLIEALKQTTETTTEEATSDAETTLAARIATTSVSVVNQVVDQVTRVFGDIRSLRVLPDVLTDEKRALIREQGPALILTILVTVLIYRFLRLLSQRIFPRSQSHIDGFWAKSGHFLAQFTLRLASVLVAWFIGYGLATAIFGGSGIAVPQALYLNAFVVFGLFSVGLSVFVSRHPDDLTFALLPARSEATIYRSLRTVAAFVIYGLIAAVPIVQLWSNFVVARSFRTILLVVCALIAIFAIRRIARTLKSDFEARKAAPLVSDDIDEFSASIEESSNLVWNHIWPPLAYLYVAVAFFVSLANPNLIVSLVGRATLLTGLAIIVALIGLRFFRWASRTVEAPVTPAMRAFLPTFGDRLAVFVRPILVIAGLGCMATALLMVLEGWQLLAVSDWLATSGANVMWRILSLVILLLALILIWALLSSYIDKRLSEELPESEQVSARSRTLLALFRNTISIALVVFGGMTLLSELGIDIAPLLAGAGVIGLAIGFGAQKLVQDIITGIFIQLENAINEGDVVTVAGITGAVEKLTIRSVGIRDLNGTYHIIPFSAVDMVGNYMRRFAYHVEIVGVAYDSDLAAVEQAMHDAYDALLETEIGREMTEPLEYNGVVALADSSVNIRARIKTTPGNQWAVGRAYTQAVKKALDAAGIEIPFPHRELKLPMEMMKRLDSLASQNGS